MRKLLPALLAMVLTFSLFSVTAFAYVTFDYQNPINQRGVIHYDGWDYSVSRQHGGYFTDLNGRTFDGVGMYVSGAGSGTSFVTYNIPRPASRFTTFICVDRDWGGTAAYGTSTFQIIIDGRTMFSKSYTKTLRAEFLDIEIPRYAKTITLQVVQKRGSRGNHACFFGEPTFK